MLKIITIIGARPQFIKAATVSRVIAQHNSLANASDSITEILVHTGQHYDDNMSRIFFDELDIPKPHYNLEIGSGPHGKQTGAMLSAIEGVLIREKPDLVLTYGDTNSTLAGALAATKLHITSAHVEAGLRSYNRRMPEEINRIIADELSNLLFCPTETAVTNLRREGIGGSQVDQLQGLDLDKQLVFNSGDVMYDSILFNKNLAEKKSKILDRLGLSNHFGSLIDYCLATIHRPENTDSEPNLTQILEVLTQITATTETRVILPLHPRTRNKIEEFGLEKKFNLLTLKCNPNSSSNPITIIDPIGYLDMVQLEKHAYAILTDSGGVQKEAYLLSVPCITLRKETEWVETLNAGWNILAGPDTQKSTNAFSMLSHWTGQSPPFLQSTNQVNSTNVYGDGKAAEKIVDIIFKTLSI